jgi:hypothetical protein
MSLKAYIESAQPVNLLAGQLVCDLDDAGGYYGSTSPTGTWCIRKLTDTTLLYCFGTGSYAAAWIDRASLTYGVPDINA